MKPEHKKKIRTTIIVAVCIFIYYAIFGALMLFGGIADANSSIIILAIIIPLVFGGVLLYVTQSRIEEIKGGEEDDISKYWFYNRKRTWNSYNC